jgi:hypothetical protein
MNEVREELGGLEFARNDGADKFSSADGPRRGK